MSDDSVSVDDASSSDSASNAPESVQAAFWDPGRVVSDAERHQDGSQDPDESHEFIILCSHCTDSVSGPTFVVPDRKLAPNGFITDFRCPVCKHRVCSQ